MHDQVLGIIETLFLLVLLVWFLYMVGYMLAGLLVLWIVCTPLILLIHVLQDR